MKEKLINAILMDMSSHISKNDLQVLEKVLTKHLFKVEVVEMETALSTEFDQNQYIIDTILFQMEKQDLSSKTIYQYKRCINSFNDICQKNFKNVSPADIEYYLKEYFIMGKNKKNSNTTVNIERRYLSACFKWMMKCNVINANPCEGVQKMKVVKKPIDRLDGIEFEILRDACDKLRERAMIEFLYSTGCRVGEAARTDIKDIDLRTGDVLLYAPKTREYRNAFLTDAARLHIKKYLDSRTDESEALFVSYKNPHTRLSECAYREDLIKIKKKANIVRRVYPHIMRKTMATDMRIHGASLEDIQLLLGHADSSTTSKFYVSVGKDQLKSAHSRCIS